MVLLIDNYDSFTYNLYQLIVGLGHGVLVYRNDAISLQEAVNLAPNHIVISPGPKRPDNAGVSLALIQHFYKTVPILGVCLGHQCIGQLFGAEIAYAKEVMHGKTSKINHIGSGLFVGLPQQLQVARYHSLSVASTPHNFTRSAWTQDSQIMALQHNQHPLHGIQFHPESFLTESGTKLMLNFLNL